MLSGFWGWFFVIVAVIIIFNAGKLPDLRKEVDAKIKVGLAALEKGKEDLNKKLAEKRNKESTSAKVENNDATTSDKISTEETKQD